MSICTRFAPSPTGYLHVGGARTALYCYLFAKKNQGKFLLRIEDTDLERSTPESVQAILDGMAWLGLASDEAPIFQTSRFDRYKEVIDQLLSEGKAYKCYCSKERLTDLREQQMQAKQKPRYDGCCRDATEEVGGDFVIRFKNPQEGDVVFNDLVLGEIKVSNQELDDLIIARSDGSPTYNFTVVIDDMDMAISHVVRGNDHVNNTPRQINLFKTLGATPPHYAHLPMILGDDGKRLSKRHGAVSVIQYKEEGYLPQAVLNYLVRLGWSHGDQEVFSLDEMIELFELTKVSKSAASFNTQKLQWLNQHYMKTLPVEEVAEALTYQYKVLGVEISQGPALTQVVDALKERSKTLKEMAEGSRFWFEDVVEYDEKALAKFIKEGVKEILEDMLSGLTAITVWDKASIHDVLKSTVESRGVKFPAVAQPIRIAVTGNTVSPSVDVTLEMLGREKSLRRIEALVDFVDT